MMDIHQILKKLPHRYPFLLVDRVLELEPGKRIKALKNVTMNEPFFEGHFPHRPVMPGVLMLEAMAQAAALLAFFYRYKQKVLQPLQRLGIHIERLARDQGGVRHIPGGWEEMFDKITRLKP